MGKKRGERALGLRKLELAPMSESDTLLAEGVNSSTNADDAAGGANVASATPSVAGSGSIPYVSGGISTNGIDPFPTPEDGLIINDGMMFEEYSGDPMLDHGAFDGDGVTATLTATTHADESVMDVSQDCDYKSVSHFNNEGNCEDYNATISDLHEDFESDGQPTTPHQDKQHEEGDVDANDPTDSWLIPEEDCSAEVLEGVSSEYKDEMVVEDVQEFSKEAEEEKEWQNLPEEMKTAVEVIEIVDNRQVVDLIEEKPPSQATLKLNAALQLIVDLSNQGKLSEALLVKIPDRSKKNPIKHLHPVARNVNYDAKICFAKIENLVFTNLRSKSYQEERFSFSEEDRTMGEFVTDFISMANLSGKGEIYKLHMLLFFSKYFNFRPNSFQWDLPDRERNSQTWTLSLGDRLLNKFSAYHQHSQLLYIDVCRNECMVFVPPFTSLRRCLFCGKERFTDSRARTAVKQIVYSPVKTTLVSLLMSGNSGEKFLKLINYKNKDARKGYIVDIMDGHVPKHHMAEMKSLFENIIYPSLKNVYSDVIPVYLLLSDFSDGVEVFRSTSYTPFTYSILNFPPNLRNTIGAGTFIFNIFHGADSHESITEKFVYETLFLGEMKKLFEGSLRGYSHSHENYHLVEVEREGQPPIVYVLMVRNILHKGDGKGLAKLNHSNPMASYHGCDICEAHRGSRPRILEKMVHGKHRVYLLFNHILRFLGNKLMCKTTQWLFEILKASKKKESSDDPLQEEEDKDTGVIYRFQKLFAPLVKTFPNGKTDLRTLTSAEVDDLVIGFTMLKEFDRMGFFTTNRKISCDSEVLEVARRCTDMENVTMNVLREATRNELHALLNAENEIFYGYSRRINFVALIPYLHYDEVCILPKIEDMGVITNDRYNELPKGNKEAFHRKWSPGIQTLYSDYEKNIIKDLFHTYKNVIHNLIENMKSDRSSTTDPKSKCARYCLEEEIFLAIKKIVEAKKKRKAEAVTTTPNGDQIFSNEKESSSSLKEKSKKNKKNKKKQNGPTGSNDGGDEEKATTNIRETQPSTSSRTSASKLLPSPASALPAPSVPLIGVNLQRPDQQEVQIQDIHKTKKPRKDWVDAGGHLLLGSQLFNLVSSSSHSNQPVSGGTRSSTRALVTTMEALNQPHIEESIQTSSHDAVSLTAAGESSSQKVFVDSSENVCRCDDKEVRPSWQLSNEARARFDQALKYTQYPTGTKDEYYIHDVFTKTGHVDDRAFMRLGTSFFGLLCFVCESELNPAYVAYYSSLSDLGALLNNHCIPDAERFCKAIEELLLEVTCLGEGLFISYEAIVMKHYLLHYPKALRHFGCLQESWTLGGERQVAVVKRAKTQGGTSSDTVVLRRMCKKENEVMGKLYDKPFQPMMSEDQETEHDNKDAIDNEIVDEVDPVRKSCSCEELHEDSDGDFIYSYCSNNSLKSGRSKKKPSDASSKPQGIQYVRLHYEDVSECLINAVIFQISCTNRSFEDIIRFCPLAKSFLFWNIDRKMRKLNGCFVDWLLIWTSRETAQLLYQHITTTFNGNPMFQGLRSMYSNWEEIYFDVSLFRKSFEHDILEKDRMIRVEPFQEASIQSHTFHSSGWKYISEVAVQSPKADADKNISPVLLRNLNCFVKYASLDTERCHHLFKAPQIGFDSLWKNITSIQRPSEFFHECDVGQVNFFFQLPGVLIDHRLFEREESKDEKIFFACVTPIKTRDVVVHDQTILGARLLDLADIQSENYCCIPLTTIHPSAINVTPFGDDKDSIPLSTYDTNTGECVQTADLENVRSLLLFELNKERSCIEIYNDCVDLALDMKNFPQVTGNNDADNIMDSLRFYQSATLPFTFRDDNIWRLEHFSQSELL